MTEKYPREFYKLHADLIAERRAELVTEVSAKFGYDPIFVDANLDRVGIPILVQDTIMTMHDPQRGL